MKILALDIGDRHTGIAISDALAIIARPLTTVSTTKLQAFIQELLIKEKVATIVIGYPKTLRGTISEQTKKIEIVKEELSKQFPIVEWVLWDERLTSKQAARLKKIQTKEDKLQSHAIAAALILSSYLEFRKITKIE